MPIKCKLNGEAAFQNFKHQPADAYSKAYLKNFECALYCLTKFINLLIYVFFFNFIFSCVYLSFSLRIFSTAMAMKCRSMDKYASPPITFTVNKPFYYVLFNRLGIVFFKGNQQKF